MEVLAETLMSKKYYLEKHCLKEEGLPCSHSSRVQKGALTRVITAPLQYNRNWCLSDKFKRHAGGSSDSVHQSNYTCRKLVLISCKEN